MSQGNSRASYMWNKYNVTSLEDWDMLSSSERAEQVAELDSAESQWGNIVTFMDALVSAQRAGLYTTCAIVILTAWQTVQGYRSIKYELREQKAPRIPCTPSFAWLWCGNGRSLSFSRFKTSILIRSFTPPTTRPTSSRRVSSIPSPGPASRAPSPLCSI